MCHIGRREVTSGLADPQAEQHVPRCSPEQLHSLDIPLEIEATVSFVMFP